MFLTCMSGSRARLMSFVLAFSKALVFAIRMTFPDAGGGSLAGAILADELPARAIRFGHALRHLHRSFHTARAKRPPMPLS